MGNMICCVDRNTAADGKYVGASGVPEGMNIMSRDHEGVTPDGNGTELPSTPMFPEPKLRQSSAEPNKEDMIKKLQAVRPIMLIIYYKTQGETPVGGELVLRPPRQSQFVDDELEVFEQLKDGDMNMEISIIKQLYRIPQEEKDFLFVRISLYFSNFP